MLWGRELAQGKGPEASVIGIERLPDHLVHSLVVRRGHTGIGLPGWLSGKESACQAGDTGSIPGSGRSPGGGNGNPLQYSGLKNPHGQRSLVGYRPWDHKELDTTEQLTFIHSKEVIKMTNRHKKMLNITNY